MMTAKIFAKKIIAASGYMLLVLLLALAGSELTLRIAERLARHMDPGKQDRLLYSLATQEMENRLYRRFWQMFLAGKKDERIFPEPRDYANEAGASPGRLAEIARHSLYPPRGFWSARDIVRAHESDGGPFFRVTTNNLGFRKTADSSARKKPGFMRVLVLGSYQAFGHGVDDADTYTAVLEARWNKRLQPKLEVLNGGMQSATAIKGLAVLRTSGERLAPDLVILDYGLVDMVTSGWTPIIEPQKLLLSPGDSLYPAATKLVNAFLTSRFASAYVVTGFASFLGRTQAADNRKKWAEVTAAALNWLEERRIPAVLLDQPGTESLQGDYLALASGSACALFRSVGALLETRTPPQGEPAWMQEFSPGLRSYLLAYRPQTRWRKSIIHLGEAAQGEIAALLLETVEKNRTRFYSYREKGTSCRVN